MYNKILMMFFALFSVFFFFFHLLKKLEIIYIKKNNDFSMDLNSSFDSHFEVDEFSPTKKYTNFANSKLQNNEATWNIVFFLRQTLYLKNLYIFSNLNLQMSQLVMNSLLFLVLVTIFDPFNLNE